MNSTATAEEEGRMLRNDSGPRQQFFKNRPQREIIAVALNFNVFSLLSPISDLIALPARHKYHTSSSCSSQRSRKVAREMRPTISDDGAQRRLRIINGRSLRFAKKKCFHSVSNYRFHNPGHFAGCRFMCLRLLSLRFFLSIAEIVAECAITRDT